MASYMVNPSKYVTEILSQFLEFDPKQLQLGIWSGDLSISDVNLKREAFAPLLNPHTAATHSPLGDIPLHLKLVKGKVGHMRVQIPWKRLVWGQGDVRLQISDVDIVLAYESREETQRRLRFLQQLESSSGDGPSDEEPKHEITEEERERKQAWLQEAERRQLQGLSIPASFEDPTKKGDQKEAEDIPENQKEARHVDSFLQQATSSIVWRFFAGLQASIRNVRIVIVQDGVEIGIIQHSIEVKPGKQQADTAATDSTAMDLSFNNPAHSLNSHSADLDSFVTPPDDVFEYEGEFEDGELVEKTCEVQGFGVFIRKMPKLTAAPPPHLQFSLSVGADDYVLRPTKLTLYLNFFYPHPPDKQKKKKKKVVKGKEEEKRTNSTDSAVSTTSSKLRRGKRDHVTPPLDTMPTPTEVSGIGATSRPSKRIGKSHKRVTSEPISALNALGPKRPGFCRMASSTDVKGNPRNRIIDGAPGSAEARTEADQVGALLPTMTKLVEQKSGTYRLGYTNEARSVMDSSRDHTSKAGNLETIADSRQSPKLELQVTFGELKAVLSSRHHHSSLSFVSTITRMRNGRPEKQIRNFLGDESPETIRSVVVTTPMIHKTTDNLPNCPKPSSLLKKRASTEGVAMLSTSSSSSLPPTTPPIPRPRSLSHQQGKSSLVRFQSEGLPNNRQLELKLNLQPTVRTKRARVVHNWWLYAYKNVLRELTELRRKKDPFTRAAFKFDWEKQRQRRKEYVNLYLSHNVNKSSALLLSVETATFLLRGTNGEETMRTIEDELPIEQILLYRSIARALRVRGIHNMESSILSLRRQNGRSLPTRTSAATPKKLKHHSTDPEYNFLRRPNHLTHSTSDWAVNESMTFSARKSMGSPNLLVVGSLQKLCGEARHRRVGEETTGEKRSIDSTMIGMEPNQKSKKRVRGGGFSLTPERLRSKASEVRSSSRSKVVAGTSSGGNHPPPITVEMSRAGDTTDRSFKTAMSTPQKKNANGKVSNQLRFSFTFKLAKLELLVLKDEPFHGSNNPDIDDSSGTSRVTDDEGHSGESRRLDLSDGNDSSDGISYLTEAFSDADGMGSAVVEDTEDTQFLSSTDFLTLGTPQGVLFDVCVTSMHIFLTGLSGGSKKAAFSVGHVLVQGEDKCPLIEAGSNKSKGIRESFLIPDVSIEQRRNILRKGLQSSGNDKDAIKASFLKMVDQERFLEVDVAKISVFAEVGAVTNIAEFDRASKLLLPCQLIEESQLDSVRDYLLQRSQESNLLGELATLDCAIRLHGVDLFVPASALAVDKRNSSCRCEHRKQLKASLKLVEYYSGSLIERICFAADENADLFSRKSSGVAATMSTHGEDNFLPDQRLKLLDICEIFDRQRGIDSAHALINASGIELALNIPSESPYGITTDSVSLIQHSLDIEVFLTTNKGSDGSGELTVAISPIVLLVSQKRVSILSEIMTLQMLHFATISPESKPKVGHPPRLEELSNSLQFSADILIDSIGLITVTDSADDRNLSATEQEMIIEESISDFLSFVSCFDLHHPVDEGMQIARQICVDRLISMGFSESVAQNCAESARHQFMADIELVREAQIQTLHEMSSSQMKQDDSFIASGIVAERELHTGDEASILSETDSALEEDSQESLDILETALFNAVEQTLSAFLPLIEGRTEVVGSDCWIEASHGFRLCLTKLFYDYHLSFDMPSLTVRNAAGIRILSLGGNVASDGDHDQSVQGFSALSEGTYTALSVSTFELDKGYEFGEGGSPLSVLGSDDQEFKRRHRERLIDTRIGTLDVIFCSKIAVDLIDCTSELLSGWKTSDVDSQPETDQISERRIEEVETTLCTEIDEASCFLMSDDLNPFSKLYLEGFVLRSLNEITVEANNMLLLNLSPEGQYFPRVIQALQPQDHSDIDGRPVVRLIYTQSTTLWKQNSSFLVEFYGVQAIVVWHYIEDLKRYFTSERYGVGHVLSRVKSEPVTDDNGNPPPPLSYKITFLESSAILPKSSVATDMVAIEFSSLDVFNSYHDESFKMPNATEPLKKSEARSFAANPPSKLDSTRSSVIEFFDCDETAPAGGSISSYENDLISRFNVRINNANIYTALPSDRSKSAFVAGVKFLREHQINGRASNGKIVFRALVDALGKGAPTTCPSRFWECITNNPVSLEILLDLVPELRILITDNVSESETTSSLDLEAKMSQFYLLLSLWYGNMQELPASFPYSTEEIKGNAVRVQPPHDFPEYATEEFIQWLLHIPATMKSEIACHLSSISMHCAFDPAGYFETDPNCLNLLPGVSSGNDGSGAVALSVALKEFVLHTATDKCGIMRIGFGARAFELVDRRKETPFDEYLTVEEQSLPAEDCPSNVWADLSFGLELNGNDLVKGALSVPLPFQATVFMTPGWNLVNVGTQYANAVMFDFTPIWILLDYYSSYFASESFGNPCFEALAMKKKMKNKLAKREKANISFFPTPGLNIHFRLWLLDPCLCIPSSVKSLDAASLRVLCNGGFWYQYKSIGSYSSQEMGTPDLSLRFSDNFKRPNFCRVDTHGGSRSLIDTLSFGLRMNSNTVTNHTDYAFRMPMWAGLVDRLSDQCLLTSSEIEVPILQLPPPTVCTPSTTIGRALGATVCECTLIVQIILQTSAMLLSFLGVSDETSSDEQGSIGDNEKAAPSFSVNTHIESLRLFIIDPTLGVHLPLASFSLSTLQIVGSMLGDSAGNQLISRRDSPPSDLQVTVKTKFWSDYFKLGITRSWEPLLEPIVCLVLYEKSLRRGEGLTLSSDNPFHLNVTGALLLTLEDAVSSLAQAISETVAEGNRVDDTRSSVRKANTKQDPVFVQQVVVAGSRQTQVQHQLPKPLSPNERIAFSLLNLTGQRIRVHQLLQRSESEEQLTSFVTYLKHGETTPLEFRATISMIQNLRLVEVPFPGVTLSQRDAASNGAVSHSVDVQLPSFRWLEGLSVDTSGRRFDDLSPRSSIVQSKLSNDWRLANTMKLLTEVGLDNGGRLITVRSLFEIRNHTTHSINLSLHPDPMYKPAGPIDPPALHPSSSESDDRDTLLGRESVGLSPGDAFQIPSLLLESALRLEGSHLGCVWVCPERSERNKSLNEMLRLDDELGIQDPSVGFSSRPVQLAKIVHESALLFQGANGEDLPPDKVRSGIQISCPIADGGDGVPVAPFCYAIEIRRSPVVRNHRDFEARPQKKVSFAKSSINRLTTQRTASETVKEKKAREGVTMTHSPVAYTIMVHPPLVIENLLPAHGRFELMHATRRSVLWFADLKPGEKVSVHTVGLDAPLLLLVNLGFCRTPVGEGALIHHGSEIKRSIPQGGFKSIGKAVTKGTKQIGKTLTSISDSPDQRGKGKVFLLQNPQYHRGTAKRTRSLYKPADAGGLGLDTDIGTADTATGHTHVVDSRVYTADDIATETVVVDSVGQKLTLKIENIRGGGSQRKISLFCPFWVVNTTEHSLRYKQDKSTQYVSGTVLSPDLDGSAAVDGSKRNATKNRRRSRRPQKYSQSRPRMDSTNVSSINQDTVFSGTPGALATFPGRCSVSRERLAKLLEKELPLEDLASIAFMFNFHEDNLLIVHQRLVVQLADGSGQSPYTSDWSPGFSLESVGVPQLVGMHCKDGRVLELSVTISVAPGFLSGYTKIVRFTPRYIVVNRLNQPIRVWQDSSLLHSIFEDRATQESSARRDVKKWHFQRQSQQNLNKENKYEMLFGRTASIEETTFEGAPLGTTAHKSALYISTVGKGELVPFHLPDTRGDRQFRIDLGGTWNLSSSFNADVTGEHTLRIRKALDLRLLRHVNTRASPHYKVAFPPTDGSSWDGELGVWFETAWGGDRKILVKGTKRGRFAFNNTDIRVGDELLQVDDIFVSHLTFAEVMKLLKECLATVASGTRIDSLRPRPSILQWKQKKFSRSESLSDFDGSADVGDDEQLRAVLTFRTLEERLRRVRVKASKAKQLQRFRSNVTTDDDDGSLSARLEAGDHTFDEIAEESHPDIKVEMRAIHNSIFVVVREQNPEIPPYRVENRAMNHFIFFRQRGCVGYPWNILQPGESTVYCWEEPMKSHKLTVRVGSVDVHLHGDESQDELESFQDGDDDDDGEIDPVEKRAARKARLMQTLSFHNIDGEDQAGFGAVTTVKLEEIGFESELPCPGTSSRRSSETALNCHVDSNGATRVLVISNNKDDRDEKHVLQHHINALQRYMREEENRAIALQHLRSTVHVHGNGSRRRAKNAESLIHEEKCELNAETESLEPSPSGRVSSEFNDAQLTQTETDATSLADFPEDCTIWRRNQIVVEVLEAAGLSTSDVTGVCNPYCEVVLKDSKKRRSPWSSSTVMRKTYFMAGSFSPKWIDQTFVFDVPSEAVENAREHTLQLRLRSFRFIGQHPYMGQTSVHLRSLRNQKELVGWYPLVGRTGPRDLEDSQANWGRGSVKLRVQWIYTVPALVDYFLMLSENKLCNLQRSLDGMRTQLNSLIENEATRNRLKKHEITKDMLKDPFGVASRLLVNRTPQKRRRQTLQKQRDLSARNNKPNENANWNVLEPVKKSRDRLLWLFYFQTEESRHARKALRSSSQENSVPVSIKTQKRTSVLEKTTKSEHTSNQADPKADRAATRFATLLPLDENSVPFFGGQTGDISETDSRVGISANETIALNKARDHPRRRSFSLEDMRKSMEVLELTKRAGPFMRSDPAILEEFGHLSALHLDGSKENILISAGENEAERSLSIDRLRVRGLVYHARGSSFHRNHLTYHFRLAFIEGAVGTDIRPKSLQRLSPSNCRFKTWLSAQEVLNDESLSTHESANKVEILFKERKHKRRVTMSEAPGVAEESVRDTVVQKVGLPAMAPTDMYTRLAKRAESLFLTRNQFERACKRSLRAVLNPGGWLTVRPMTALNLPDIYTGMSVKLRYGSLTLSTHTVDAKVTPTWAAEKTGSGKERRSGFLRSKLESFRTVSNDTPIQPNFSVDDAYAQEENDLSIPIDPQKTSGSIRLAVVGERLNTKVELGVLDIPLGAAISCCVECMENTLDEAHSIDNDDVAYIRWFPLMNPKDTISVDGDMGYSGRPLETEKVTDTLFSQYFSPCIKLALIWRPRDADDATDGNEHGDVLSHYETQNSDAALTKSYFNADFTRISCALIDSQRGLELIALSASDIDLRYFESKAKTRVGAVIGWIQIDHQVEGTKEPVVLAPTPVMHPDPTLQFLAYRDNLRSKGSIDSYELIAFYMEELDLTIEESWVVDLWEFLVSIVRRREVKKRAVNFQSTSILIEKNELIRSMRFVSPNDEYQQSLLEILWQDDNSESKTYIEKLYLGPIRLNLSYLKGRRTTGWDSSHMGSYLLDGVDSMPDVFDIGKGAFGFGNASKEEQFSETFAKWTEFTHDEDLWTESGQGKQSVNLPNLLAAVLPSVSEAPIRLQGKGITFIFENKSEIFNSVKNYYVNETLRQIYKIVGSLDFVGNPTMVLNSFATGVRDFFVAPSKAFLKSPRDPSRVGIGVVKGTLSLLSHSASGIFGFAAKMSALAGQAAAIFSFDNDYQLWHRDMILSEAKNLDRHWKRRGVEGLSRIITRPLFDLLRGFVLGTTGLIVSPIKGAKEEGAVGLVKGIAIGSVGVLAKPIVGVLDALSHFAGSIHDVAKSVNVLEKRYRPAKKLRLPYTFGLRNVLIPFNSITARSVLLLKQIPISKSLLAALRVDKAVAVLEVHVSSELLKMEPDVETFVIVSTLRVLLAKVKKDSSGAHTSSFCWEVPLIGGAKISSRVSDQGHNGVALTIAMGISSPASSNVDVGRAPSRMAPTTPHSRRETKLGASNVSFYFSKNGTSSDGKKGGKVSQVNAPRMLKTDVLVDPLQLERDDEPGLSVPSEHSFMDQSVALHTSMTAPTGDLLEFYSVLAEFAHRRQLSRVHNAICCICGDMGGIIFDRGLNRDGSTEGYTSFGEFFFTEMNERPSDCAFHAVGRTHDIEDMPWIQHSFFQKVAVNNGIDVHEEFSEMRRWWKLEKEIEASEVYGGPEWLVRARAEATFVSEPPPDISSGVPQTEALQRTLMKLCSGSISYDEAADEILIEIDRIERSRGEEQIALTDEMDDAPSEILSHFTSRRYNIASPSVLSGDSSSQTFQSAREERASVSVDEFKSTNEFFSPLQAGVAKRTSGSNMEHDEKPLDGADTDAEGLDTEDQLQSISGFARKERLLQSRTPLKSVSKASTIFAETKGKDTHKALDDHQVRGQLSSSHSAHGLRDSAETSDSSVGFVSTDNRLVPMSTPTPDPKMDRLELMLEKLLEVSILNAAAAQHPLNTPDAALFSELAKLRSVIEVQQQRENETVTLLRNEIDQLKDQLEMKPKSQPNQVMKKLLLPTVAILPELLQKSGQAGSKKVSKAAKKIGRRVSKIFRKGNRPTSLTSLPPPEFLDGDVPLQVVGDKEADEFASDEESNNDFLVDNMDLDDLVLEHDKISKKIRGAPGIVVLDRHVSDLTHADL